MIGLLSFNLSITTFYPLARAMAPAAKSIPTIIVANGPILIFHQKSCSLTIMIFALINNPKIAPPRARTINYVSEKLLAM